LVSRTVRTSDRLPEEGGDAQHHQVEDQPPFVQRRVAESVEALHEGDHPTAHEQGHRHQERPEVELLAPPERVAHRRAEAAGGGAAQQEQLVARVGHRVEGLGQHGGAAADGGRHELDHGDAHVGHQGHHHHNP
jgi:hypothetical protein